MKKSKTENKLPTYGGQALIEGVLMRGRKSLAIAMRSPDNKIILHTEALGGIYKSKIAKIPFLRGLVLLWDAIGLGIRALTISANVQTGEEEKIEGPIYYLTLGVSFSIGIGLFLLAPAAAGQLFENFLGLSAWWGNLIEGIVRLILLISYMWAIGHMPEIQRVFAYHGAEHKTINAFEAGVTLSPEKVSDFSVEHPRCGTAFLLTLVLVSIILFSMLGPLPVLWRLTSRILLLPVLAGISYEYIRWTSDHLDSKFVQFIVKPNLLLQGLTTREPSLEMLEVSIAAFNAMYSEERTLST